MASADHGQNPQTAASRKWQTDIAAVRRACMNVAETAAKMRRDAAQMRRKAVQMRERALEARARAAELRAAAAEQRARRANERESANVERRIVREERDFAARLRLVAGVGRNRTDGHRYLNGNSRQVTGDDPDR